MSEFNVDSENCMHDEGNYFQSIHGVFFGCDLCGQTLDYSEYKTVEEAENALWGKQNKAGHRIDELPSVMPTSDKVVVKQPDGPVKPLVDMGAGVLVKKSRFTFKTEQAKALGNEMMSHYLELNNAGKDIVKSTNHEKPNTLSERVSESGITRTCDVREAFEKWFTLRTDPPKGTTLNYSKCADGDYRSYGTQHAWEAWKARQAEVDQLKNELLAQDKRMMRTFALVKQWRDEAVSPRLGFEPDITGTLESCADELEKALGGGV